MGWRFLVDEDTDIDTVDELIERGHDAVAVGATLGRGAVDAHVARFAREESRVLISTDRDFLDPELHADLRVLLVVDGDAEGHEIAERADALAHLADAPTDLRGVTWI